MKIFVTGGAGFIGSALVRSLVRDKNCHVLTLDKLTYAGDLKTLEGVSANSLHRFERLDILQTKDVLRCLLEFSPDAVFHLAAETHVDRSISGPAVFLETNVTGTLSMLEATKCYWEELKGPKRATFRFIHVSTDEVYGSLGPKGKFTELSPYRPNSPYAASKAGSDHLARAWHVTYGFPSIITHASNNYGPYQFPEKLIPLCILKALKGDPIPVYGTGKNIRDWLHVEDHVEGLWNILKRGKPGETYNIGGGTECTNLELVKRVCSLIDILQPRNGIGPRSKLITHVPDRPGHDLRYAIDTKATFRKLGWKAKMNLDEGLKETILWYLSHPEWCQHVQEKYAGERLGLARAAK